VISDKTRRGRTEEAEDAGGCTTRRKEETRRGRKERERE
jgi:hypothetical protein